MPATADIAVTEPEPDKAVLEANEEAVVSYPEYVRQTLEVIPDSLRIEGDYVIYGDFNADGREDFASKVTNLQNGKQGVLIIHAGKEEYHVFGAGKEINEMDDLKWIDIFKPLPNGYKVAATLVDTLTGDIIGPDEKNAFALSGNGIYMHVDEACGGGILYWSRSEYEWLHLE